MYKTWRVVNIESTTEECTDHADHGRYISKPRFANNRLKFVSYFMNKQPKLLV